MTEADTRAVSNNWLNPTSLAADCNESITRRCGGVSSEISNLRFEISESRTAFWSFGLSRESPIFSETVTKPARSSWRRVAIEHKAELRERLRGMARQIEARKPDALADALLLLIEGVFVSSQLFGPGGPATAVRAAAEALFDAYGPETR